MAKILIKAGAEIDIPTREELQHDIHGAVRDVMTAESERQRARARGFVPLRLTGPIGGKTTFLLDAVPESGYVFNLKLLSVQLASAGTLLAYIASSAPATGATPSRLIANASTSNANQVMTWSSSQVLVYPDESIYLVATQNMNVYFLIAAQVPAEMVYKVYD
jgi:hypothetical protein